MAGRSRSSARREHWARLIAEWRRSGKTQTAFCASRDVSVQTFRWWKSQLGRPSAKTKSSTTQGRGSRKPAASFVPVDVVAASSASVSSIEVVLGSGRSIRVQGDFDPRILRKVVDALEDGAC